jgi:hypothetical protein
MSSTTESIDAATATKLQNNVQRFQKGVELLGKLIGIEDVKQDSGDEVCKTAMIKLKAVVKAKKEPKQKLTLKLTLDGIEIFDRLTNASLHKHSVNRISYIARDPTDSRAIGYIYKNSAKDLEFFAIKTQDQAQELFNALKDLFETVLEMKKKDSTDTPAVQQTDSSAKQSNEEPKSDDALIIKQAVADNNALITNLKDKLKNMSTAEPTPSLLDVTETPSPLVAPSISSSNILINTATPANTPATNSKIEQDIFQTSLEKSLDKNFELTASTSSKDLMGIFTTDPGKSKGANVNMFDKYSILNAANQTSMPNFALSQAPPLPQHQSMSQQQLFYTPNPFQSQISQQQQQAPLSPFYTPASPAANPFASAYQQSPQYIPRPVPAHPAAAPQLQPPLPPLPPQSQQQKAAALSSSPFANLITPDLFVPNPPSSSNQAQSNNNNSNQFPW